MSSKLNVTVPVDFTVKEGGSGSYWISIEIGSSAADRLPAVLDDVLIGIRARDGVSFRKVEELAEVLRQHFSELHFQHPIQQ